MFFPEGRIRVFLYGQPADMRKSYDGLYALARQGFDADPLAGHLFVFANRRAKQTTFSIPIAVCRDRVSVAPAVRQEGPVVSTRRQAGSRGRARRGQRWLVPGVAGVDV